MITRFPVHNQRNLVLVDHAVALLKPTLYVTHVLEPASNELLDEIFEDSVVELLDVKVALLILNLDDLLRL